MLYFVAIFRPIMQISSTHVLKRAVLWTKLVSYGLPPGWSGWLPFRWQIKEVGGPRHRLQPDRDSQSPEWGAFDDKFKILASAWSSSDLASASRHVKLETAVVR